MALRARAIGAGGMLGVVRGDVCAGAGRERKERTGESGEMERQQREKHVKKCGVETRPLISLWIILPPFLSQSVAGA
jgi:hypothetical protein